MAGKKKLFLVQTILKSTSVGFPRTNLSEAAGLMGRQRWALIHSSSARVSRVTYETVIAVRYPELDSKGPDEVYFGTYLADQQAAVGGFLSIFWKAPFDSVLASTDLGLMVEWINTQPPLSAGENGCLAVLHNRNDMVNAFNRSEWVATAESRIIFGRVISCASTTAHHVLLAQSKIGFLDS